MKFRDREGWGPLHDLTLLYLALCHGTDAVLHPNEVAEGKAHLGRWAPDWPPDVVSRVFEEGLMLYVGQNRDEMLRLSAEALRQTLPAHLRVRILNELADLAHADGVVIPAEVAFIQQLAGYWRVTGNEDTPAAADAVPPSTSLNAP